LLEKKDMLARSLSGENSKCLQSQGL